MHTHTKLLLQCRMHNYYRARRHLMLRVLWVQNWVNHNHNHDAASPSAAPITGQSDNANGLEDKEPSLRTAADCSGDCLPGCKEGMAQCLHTTLGTMGGRSSRQRTIASGNSDIQIPCERVSLPPPEDARATPANSRVRSPIPEDLSHTGPDSPKFVSTLLQRRFWYQHLIR